MSFFWWPSVSRDLGVYGGACVYVCTCGYDGCFDG